jgi:hypothetical protein
MAEEKGVAPLKGNVSALLIIINKEDLQKRHCCSFQSRKRREVRGQIQYGNQGTG